MFVGLVNALRVPVRREPSMLSAGRPVALSVIASIDRQVSRAYVVSVLVAALVAALVAVLLVGSAVAVDVVAPSPAPSARVVVAATAVSRLRRGFMRISRECWRGLRYLMPVIAMPCMIRRCRTRKIAMTGITTTTAPASRRPYFVAFWPTE